MPFMVLKAAYLELDSVDRSQWTAKVELTAEVEEKDVTTFAAAGWKVVLGGIASGQLAVTFKNDLASGSLDELMWALFGNVVSFAVRASTASVGANNPEYSGSVLLKSWTPIAGAPGDVNEASYTWPTSGAITRSTS